MKGDQFENGKMAVLTLCLVGMASVATGIRDLQVQSVGGWGERRVSLRLEIVLVFVRSLTVVVGC